MGIYAYDPPMTNLLSNRDARRVFLAKQGLANPPNRALTKAGLLQLIHDIGFVQVDSIGTVERAHHQILFSRNQTYRREHLTELLEKDGALFENWTHDASILPSAFFVYWKHRFRREEAAIIERWRKWRGEGFEAAFEETYERVLKNDHRPRGQGGRSCLRWLVELAPQQDGARIFLAHRQVRDRRPHQFPEGL